MLYIVSVNRLPLYQNPIRDTVFPYGYVLKNNIYPFVYFRFQLEQTEY